MESDIRNLLNSMRATSPKELSNKELHDIFDNYVLRCGLDNSIDIYNAVLWDVYGEIFLDELKGRIVADDNVNNYINQFETCLMCDEDFRQIAAATGKVDYRGYETYTYTLADFCKDLPDRYNDFKLGVLI